MQCFTNVGLNFGLVALLLAGGLAWPCAADDAVTAGDGAVQFTKPAGWEKRQPKNNIIEAEFAGPAVGDDKTEVRITVSGGGGGVDANITRWLGQFQLPDGGAVTREKAKIEKKTINGQETHLVDVAGTYLDKPFPQSAESTPRKNWRMLAAIVVTEKVGTYFVKLYGPAAAVAAQEKAFEEFVGSVKVK